MTVALALLAGAALVGWLAPRRLVRLTDPVVALVAWLVSVVAVVATAAAAMFLLVVPDHGLGVVAAFHHCWNSLQHGTTPTIEAVSGATGVVLLTALLVRVAVVGRRTARQRAQEGRRHMDVLRVAARREAGPHPTLWLEPTARWRSASRASRASSSPRTACTATSPRRRSRPCSRTSGPTSKDATTCW